MHTHFDISDQIATIQLHGRLTFAENSAFRQVVETLEQAGREQVVFDLARLDYIDSAGMGMLLVARDLAAGRGGAVTLANAEGQVARMLRLAKFGDFFTLNFACAQV